MRPCTAVGMRVDVDTLRGTRAGVPRLLEIFARHGVSASFFFSVGPDNMGRNLWRLLNPAFLRKMLRSRAASLYGWDILLSGAFWPGPDIGRHSAATIRAAAESGHEIGLHAWDHYAWQRRVERWSVAEQQTQMRLGLLRLGDIIGRGVDCCAVAGWRCNQLTIEAEQAFAFRYSSDCRGSGIFRPLLADGSAGTPQVPVTLPTYDEVVGRGTDRASYNAHLLSRMRADKLLVYTAHAEVEGMVMAAEFDQLLGQAALEGLRFAPLGALLPSDTSILPTDSITTAVVPGREGWVGWQASALAQAG